MPTHDYTYSRNRNKHSNSLGIINFQDHSEILQTDQYRMLLRTGRFLYHLTFSENPGPNPNDVASRPQRCFEVARHPHAEQQLSAWRSADP